MLSFDDFVFNVFMLVGWLFVLLYFFIVLFLSVGFFLGLFGGYRNA